jgi:hypothetical protein
MAEYYDIPTRTLGAAGLSIDLGVGGVSGTRNGVYITIVETAGVAYNVQKANGNNDYEAAATVQGSQPYQVKRVPNVRFLTITGSGATVTGKVTDYEVDPSSILVSGPVSATITGTVKTDFGQSAAPGDLVVNTGDTAISAAAIDTATGTVASAIETIGGQPMMVTSQQDPAQVTPASGPKSVPVKVYT